MRFFNTVILFLLFSIAAASANPKKIVTHGNSFSLSRPFVVVAPKGDKVTAQEVVGVFNSFGISTKVGKGGISKAKVVLEKVRTIEGAQGTDALQVIVTSNKVTVRYTTEPSRRKAIEYLRKMISDRVIQGFDVVDWSGDSSVKSRNGAMDATSSKVSIQQIENYVRNQRGKEAYVQFVDTKNWRLETSVFKLINPSGNIYPSNGHYAAREIVELNDRLSKNRMVMIPVVELLGTNAPFEKVTGHTPNSVEGMRFVRAIIEEYATVYKFRKISFGSITKDTDKRYIEFLNDMAKRYNVEIIFND